MNKAGEKGSRGEKEQGSRGAEELFPLFLLVLLIASIPSIYAVIETPQGAMWSGLISRNTNDINGYLSIIEEIRSDGLLAHNLMTAEPHPAFQFRPFHASLAILGKIFPILTPVTLLEIGRIIATIFFLTILAQIVLRFFYTTTNRIFAFVIILFSSGLGWLHFINDPPDLRYSELSTFSSLVSAPLYQFSLGCVLAVILYVSKAYGSESRQYQLKQSLIAAVFAVLLGLERPFSLVTLGFAMITLLVIELFTKRNVRKLFRIGIPIGIASAVVIFFQFYLIRTIDVYGEWNRQNILPSPPLIAIFVSLGLLIPLAIIGFPDAIKRHRELALLCCCYAISSIVCSKLPVGVQERFLEGLPISTQILAAIGAVRIKNNLRQPALRTIFAVLLIVILIPSNFIVMRNDLQKLSNRMAPQFMPLAFIDALHLLKKFSKPGEAILSMEIAGNFAIAYSVRPTVISHRIGTARINEKKQIVTELLALNSESPEAKALIRKTLGRWLFWGPEERDFSRGAFNPEKASYLRPIYRNNMVAIYRINL
jgi:hypothetical protein